MAYLKFNVGDVKNVEFHKFNTGLHKPSTKQGYSDQYMYQVKVNGEEITWYASMTANAVLQDNLLQVGDVVQMARVAEMQYVYTRNGIILMKKEGSQVTSPGSCNCAQDIRELKTDVSWLKGMFKDKIGTVPEPSPPNVDQTHGFEGEIVPPPEYTGEKEIRVEDIPF